MMSSFETIRDGVPQGSIPGPVLYTIYTADMPQHKNTTLATFADDTAILSANLHPDEASRYLQEHLDKVVNWAIQWKIKQ